MKRVIFSLILPLALIVFVRMVLAYSATEAFTYTAGTNNLDGNNDGTCWNEAWQDHAGGLDWNVVASGQTGNGVEAVFGDSDGANDRNFSGAITNGTFSYYGNQVVGTGYGIIYFNDTTGGTERFNISFQRSGIGTNVYINSAANSFGNWSTNTFHLIEGEFGDTGGSGTCAADQVRARLDGGTWSSCIAYSNAGTVGSLCWQWY